MGVYEALVCRGVEESACLMWTLFIVCDGRVVTPPPGTLEIDISIASKSGQIKEGI